MNKDIPIFPMHIIEMMKLIEPVQLSKTTKLLQNKKNGQFSVKVPVLIMRELDWSAGDKIDIIIEDDGLKLKKCE
jgi:hypothetical protein